MARGFRGRSRRGKVGESERRQRKAEERASELMTSSAFSKLPRRLGLYTPSGGCTPPALRPYYARCHWSDATAGGGGQKGKAAGETRKLRMRREGCGVGRPMRCRHVSRYEEGWGPLRPGDVDGRTVTDLRRRASPRCSFHAGGGGLRCPSAVNNGGQGKTRPVGGGGRDPKKGKRK
ncbi:hypothetical protein NL676_017825 [Syzygium grande]|nr:hypothetical protein NL676_017825 [Syzygium grande]